MRGALPLVLISAAIAGPSLAGTPSDPAYRGAWVIAGSVPAPWLKSAADLVAEERARLIGQRIVLSAKGIAAPSPLRCKRPRYRIKPYSTDMLFQGSLTDPAAQAAALGFPDGATATLETGCEGPLEFHFVDGGTAMFALNNAVYTMKKAR